jgi:hypothetical protein
MPMTGNIGITIRFYVYLLVLNTCWAPGSSFHVHILTICRASFHTGFVIIFCFHMLRSCAIFILKRACYNFIGPEKTEKEEENGCENHYQTRRPER